MSSQGEWNKEEVSLPLLRRPQSYGLGPHPYDLTGLFFFFFLAVLGLCCCAQALSRCSEQGLLFLAVRGLLIVVASLVAEHGL